MCAAPGSKSTQCLGIMQAQVRILCFFFGYCAVSGLTAGCMHAQVPAGQCLSGVVVCNDRDPERAQRRLPARLTPLACPGVLVTQASAGAFPNVDAVAGTASGHPDPRVLYDRVLADVPCSGDGTLRKNPGAWHTFDPLYGVRLHQTQVKILSRAYALLAPGGRLVYSTCTLDPVQNEAVVLALLVQSGGVVGKKMKAKEGSYSLCARGSASSRARCWWPSTRHWSLAWSCRPA